MVLTMAQIPLDVQATIKRLRYEAEQSSRLADSLEAHFRGSSAVASVTGVSATASVGQAVAMVTSGVGIEQLKTAMRLKGGRPSHYAARMGVTPEEIQALVKANPNEIGKTERGYLFLKPKPILNPQPPSV